MAGRLHGLFGAGVLLRSSMMWLHLFTLLVGTALFAANMYSPGGVLHANVNINVHI